MERRALGWAVLLTGVSVFASPQALAAGYALKEQSATAQGASFAGASAGGDNISYLFFNPATITLHEGMQAHVTTSYIAPVTRPDVKSATYAGGAPIGGSSANGGADSGVNAFVPAAYGSWQVSDDVWLGIGVNVPFGLETSYENDWPGRFHAIDSELLSVNVNPVVAWKAPKWFSFAAGVQLQYISARLTNNVDVPPGPPDEAYADLEGDDFAIGFNLGVLFEPWDGTRLGFSFRSQIDHTLKGEVELSAPVAAIGLPGGKTDIESPVTTPATWSLGLYQSLDEDWALLAELAWTGWSAFDELRVDFQGVPTPDSVTLEQWDDSWFAALGAEYRASDALTLRGGLAFDESPIPSDTRTPRLPGADRYWASLGGSYVVSDWLTLEGALTGIYLDDPDVDLTVAGDPNNLTRGNLSIDYDSWIGIISLSGTLRF